MSRTRRRASGVPSVPCSLLRPRRPGAPAPSLGAARKEPWGGVEHEEKTDPDHGRRGGAAAGDGRPCAGADRRARSRRCVRYGWLLQLRAPTKSQRHDQVPLPVVEGRQGRQGDHRRRQQDPRRRPDDLRYNGVAAWRLVGRIDDKDPTTFNKKLAATGYNVVVEGVDGFAVTYTSAEIATLQGQLIVADRANDAAARARHGLDQERRGQLEAQLAAQARHQRRRRLRQAQAGRRSPRISIVPARPGRAAGRRAATAGSCSCARPPSRSRMTKYRFQSWKAAKGVRATIVDDNKTPDDAPTTCATTASPLARSSATSTTRTRRPSTRSSPPRPGYNVVIEGVDGFAVTCTSDEIATLQGQAHRRRPPTTPPLTLGRPRQERTPPAGSPTGRSSSSPATPACSATASRPGSCASASCRRSPA